MTRTESALKNSRDKVRKNKTLIINTVTGLYSNEYKKPSGEWNITKIAAHTHLTRQTVSKYLRIWEYNQGSLFEEELGTIKGIIR